MRISTEDKTEVPLAGFIERGAWTHDICLSLLGLTIDVVNVVYEEDDLHAAAALSWREKAGVLRSPVQFMVWHQLERGLSAR